MIGERIRALRKERSMKQQELAERLGISTSAIGMYEQNRRLPSQAVLSRMCQLFSVSSDFLLWGIEQQKTAAEVELAGRLEELRTQLKQAEVVTYQGQTLTDEQLDAVFHAMELGVQLVLKQQKE